MLQGDGPCTHLLKEYSGSLRVSSSTWRFCKTAVSSTCITANGTNSETHLIKYKYFHHTNRIEVGHRTSLVGVYETYVRSSANYTARSKQQ